MAKFSDSLRDTVGSVLEGYISAYGGDPTVTPTYQARKKREELALEQEKARAKSVQDAADRAAELEMYEAKKRIDQSFEDPDGLSDEQIMSQGVLESLRRDTSGGLALGSQRMDLQQTSKRVADELAATVGERASQTDPSLYRPEVRPAVTSLIRASTEVRTSGVLSEDAKEQAYIDIANQLANYDEDMIPQMTPEQQSMKNDEIFRINMTPLTGGAYGYTDKNTGAMKILHNNAEVARHEAELAQEAERETRKAQEFASLNESVAAIPDRDIVEGLDAEYGKGSLAGLSPEDRTEAISLYRQKLTIQKMQEKSELFNVPDLIAYEQLIPSEKKYFRNLAAQSLGGYVLDNGEVQGVDSEELTRLPQIEERLFIADREARRARYRSVKNQIDSKTASSLIAQSSSNPQLRKALIARLPQGVLAEAALTDMDPLEYAVQSGQAQILKGGTTAQETPAQQQSVLRRQTSEATVEKTEDPQAKEPVSQESESQAEQAQAAALPYKNPEVRNVANDISSAYGTDARFMEHRGDQIVKLRNEAGLDYDQAMNLIQSVNPYMFESNRLSGMSEDDAILDVVEKTVEATINKREDHISTLTKSQQDTLIEAGTPILTGSPEEVKQQILVLEQESPGATYITADGYIQTAGKELGQSPGEIAKDFMGSEFMQQGAGRLVARPAGGLKDMLTSIKDDIKDIYITSKAEMLEKTDAVGIPNTKEEIVAFLDYVTSNFALGALGSPTKEAGEAKEYRKKALERYIQATQKPENVMVAKNVSYNQRMSAVLDQFKSSKEDLERLRQQEKTVENQEKIVAKINEIKILQELAQEIQGDFDNPRQFTKPSVDRYPSILGPKF